MLITCFGAQERRGAVARLKSTLLGCSQQLLEGIMSGTHWSRCTHGILSVRICIRSAPGNARATCRPSLPKRRGTDFHLLQPWAAFWDDGDKPNMSMPDDALRNRGIPNHAAQAFMAHALAGAAAGMAETAVMYPVDTIKTRLQVRDPPALVLGRAPALLSGLCVMHATKCLSDFPKPWLSTVL